MAANLTDKDIIDLIRHITYLKQQLKIRDRMIIKIKLELEQLKTLGKSKKFNRQITERTMR